MGRRDHGTWAEDDGRTIADMSGLERAPWLIPHRPRKKTTDSPDTDTPAAENRPLPPTVRRAMVADALKAALLIALAFLAGGALLILFLQWIWSH